MMRYWPVLLGVVVGIVGTRMDMPWYEQVFVMIVLVLVITRAKASLVEIRRHRRL